MIYDLYIYRFSTTSTVSFLFTFLFFFRRFIYLFFVLFISDDVPSHPCHTHTEYPFHGTFTIHKLHTWHRNITRIKRYRSPVVGGMWKGVRKTHLLISLQKKWKGVDNVIWKNEYIAYIRVWLAIWMNWWQIPGIILWGVKFWSPNRCCLGAVASLAFQSGQTALEGGGSFSTF